MQIFVYVLRCSAELARRNGAAADAGEYSQLAAHMSAAARSAFFDSAHRVFVSGPQRQISWGTQAWMALAGIASAAEGAAALRAVAQHKDEVKPGGPYLWHYVAEAMVKCGMRDHAIELIRSYWGGMVDAGADTFWEVWDPANPAMSPYGSTLINSYCHAWSCTPSWFLRGGAA